MSESQAKWRGTEEYKGNYSDLLATKGGLSWFDVDGEIGSRQLPISPSTSNGLRGTAGAEESRPRLKSYI